jgi:hypothetical protein
MVPMHLIDQLVQSSILPFGQELSPFTDNDGHWTTGLCDVRVNPDQRINPKRPLLSRCAWMLEFRLWIAVWPHEFGCIWAHKGTKSGISDVPQGPDWPVRDNKEESSGSTLGIRTDFCIGFV